MEPESMNRSPEKPKSRTRGILSTLAYFTVVGLVVAGVYLLSPDTGSTDDEPEAVGSPTTLLEPIDVEVPSFVPGEEPIADAAQIILPSVVHIQTPNGLGSGVIYSQDGLIVTAAHIVEGFDTVRVRFFDGEQVDGTVLGTAPEVDIAVIKVARSDLHPASFNLEKPRVGQLAIAVGSPFTLESTVTAGIISAVDRANCDDGRCTSMLQTDAAINPGNSGGALVNRDGQVIGVNVSIFSQTGANEGVGFAVPSRTVIAYTEGIVAGTPLEAAFLGVRGEFASGGQAGALITQVMPGTAAEAAGVMVDDVVIAFDGVLVQGIDDLAAQVRAHRPGDMVGMVLLRGGDEMTIEVTLGSLANDAS